MTKDDLSMLLTQSEPGERLMVPFDQLVSHFPSPHEAGGMGKQGLAAAARFAQEHNCDFNYDTENGEGTFTKRPNPHALAAHFSAIGA